MKRIRLVSVGLSLMACLGMQIPPAALAELPVAKPQASTMDVTLHAEGLLVGQVVNPQGTAKEGVAVVLTHGGKELVRTKTDKLGRFAVKGLKGGIYKLATSGAVVPIRAWTSPTAPPTAAVGALLVEGMTVRGQYPTLADPSIDATTTPNTTTYHVGAEGIEPAAEDVEYGGQPATADPAGSYANGPYYEPYPNSGQPGYYGDGYAPASGRGLFGLHANPVLIGAGIAAAIAIPVALNSNDDDDAS